jgi:D-beta-D-heptose 7-phosphate kinase/D-beta-D-heptose 1-phosphate adenosyltransferase
MNLLKEFLKRNREKKLKIHCVGDAMIDEYYDVKVNRISPEFPMPIMWSADNWPIRMPGGAANVVYQFKHFNVDELLVCWCDDLGKSVFTDHQIRWSHALASECCTLPIKKRFLDNGIQVVRHDIEIPLCGLDEHVVDFATTQITTIIQKTFKPDVAILSDYNKGFFSSEEYRVLDYYRDVLTIVDPKKGPISKWKGCTIFKLNSKEAAELSGRTNWKEQAKQLQSELECEAVVITFGGERVSGIWKNDFFNIKPEHSVVVESVVGAGDCFAAFFAMAVGHGFCVPDAAEIAWNAGANYVQNRRNRPIVPAELDPTRIIDAADLASRDFKLVFTNGCFDILHEGHIKTLEFAKSKGDKLVVAINSDASVKKLKGENRPIKPLDQRMAVMSALRMVDFVVSFDEDTPLELIKKINPDVLVKGQDYSTKEIVGADLVSEVYRAPIIGNLSSSDFIKS